MAKIPGLVRFGKEVKKMRIDRDMSRKKLSEITGYSISYIGGLERGERNPSLLTIVRIGEAMGEKEFLVRF